MSKQKILEGLPDAEFESVPETEKKSSVAAEKFVAAFSLLTFTALTIIKPIIVRLAQKETAHKETAKHSCKFAGSTTVFAIEFLKIIFCCIAILIKHCSLEKLFLMVIQSFTINKIETLKICMPALVFVLQNNLYFFALQRIDATLFSVTFQLRILTTAVLMMIVLDRRFTLPQWISLILSVVGIVIVQLGGQQHQSEHHAAHSLYPSAAGKFLGLAAVLLMCLTTAFGSVYMEAVMKKSEADIFLQNIRLSLISLPVSVVAMFFDHEKIVHHGFFYKWNFYVWLVVFISAIGGIVVSAVIRHADNVKKGFCQALAIGGTASLAILLGDSTFSFYLLAGILIVICSVILYALTTRRSKKENEENKALVDSVSEDLEVVQKESNPAV